MSFSAINQQIKIHMDQRLPEYLALLEKMVAINSFTANPLGVNELGLFTAQFFATMGFTAETVQSEDALYGQHLILTRPGRKTGGRPAPKIGLVSHLDTVFPPDEELRNDFAWREEGDRIFGPGVVDIKGGTIMIAMILDAIKTVVPDLFESTTWIILLDATEETGGKDFGRLCVQRLCSDPLACLIFEPGNWSNQRPHLVVARKGMVVYRIEVEGKAAHAGSAHQNGANAVVQIADVIKQISDLTDYQRDLTFNVGTVAGGTVINRVPHFASASVEMRAFDLDVYEEGIANLLALNDLSTVGAEDGEFTCRVRAKVLYKVLPWSRNEKTDQLWSVWQETAAALGLESVAEKRAGLSDGNYFWNDLPTLDGLGPAGGNAHCSERSPDGSKEQEYVLRSSFVPKAHLNAMAIIRLVESHS